MNVNIIKEMFDKANTGHQILAILNIVDDEITSQQNSDSLIKSSFSSPPTSEPIAF